MEPRQGISRTVVSHALSSFSLPRHSNRQLLLHFVVSFEAPEEHPRHCGSGRVRHAEQPPRECRRKLRCGPGCCGPGCCRSSCCGPCFLFLPPPLSHLSFTNCSGGGCGDQVAAAHRHGERSRPHVCPLFSVPVRLPLVSERTPCLDLSAWAFLLSCSASFPGCRRRPSRPSL